MLCNDLCFINCNETSEQSLSSTLKTFFDFTYAAVVALVSNVIGNKKLYFKLKSNNRYCRGMIVLNLYSIIGWGILGEVALS